MPEDPSRALRVGRRLYWIDWLRFLAAFAVLAEHARKSNWGPRFPLADSAHPFFRCVFYSATTSGKYAVIVFFVLSGWLVGGNVLRKVRTGTFDAASYAADRLARVYVPLVPALLFTAALVRALDVPISPGPLLSPLLGLQGIYTAVTDMNTPLWTLSYEVWFYLLAGCAGVVCRQASTGVQRTLAGTVAVVAAVHCLLLDWASGVCWLLGVAGPWLRSVIAPRGRGWLAAGSALVLAAGIVADQMTMLVLPRGNFTLPPAAALQTIIAASALLLVACLVDWAPTTHAGRLVERAGTPLAAFSYTLYLTHYPVLWALALCLEPMPRMLDVPSTLRYALWISVCLGAALGMYALFERQTPRVRRWLRERFAATPAGLTTPRWQ